MSTEKGAAILGNSREGAYSATWALANEAIRVPETYGELAKLYGDGLKLVDALFWAKRYTDISTRAMTVISEGHFWDTLTTSAQVNAVGDGADITVSSLDDVRAGMSLEIPAEFFTGALVPQVYRITSRTYATPNVYTCSPFLNISLDVNIPAATQLIVGASSYAAGTQQPAASVMDYYTHHHHTRILKETVDFEGGENAIKEYEDMKSSEYGASLYARAVLISQMKMRLQQNDYVLMGYPNLNSLEQVNRHNEANAILSDYGLIPAMALPTGAMKQYYTGSYAEDNLDSVKFLLASQGLSGMNSVFFGLGQELFTSIENNMLKFIREYSGGTDLYYSDLNKVGFNVREIFKNNTKFYLCEIPEFSDPTRYAAPGFNFETMGLIFPDSKVTATLNGFDPKTMANAKGEKRSLNHLSLGFLNYGKENRKMIVGNKAGVNGMGIPFSDDWDDSSLYSLCEMMVILLSLNQTILVLKTD
jgi:hypothetical protein